MEQSSTPPLMPQEPPASKKQNGPTPWGLFIGLVLILAIVVGAAYYTLTERLAPPQAPASQSSQP